MKGWFPIYILTLISSMMGCTGPSVPEVYDDSKELPIIYPDYANATIPINMAPLTFELDEEADEMIARFSVLPSESGSVARNGDEEIICAGKAQPDIDA